MDHEAIRRSGLFFSAAMHVVKSQLHTSIRQSLAHDQNGPSHMIKQIVTMKWCMIGAQYAHGFLNHAR
jgi:hypothetical protein